MKILDTRIYLKPSNSVLSEQARDKFKVFVHDGQNQMSFQRQLFTADRSRYVVNDFCSRQMKSKKSVNLITMKILDNNRNNLQIRLSPLKSPILRKYINPFKRPGMYPSISKCNAKKCNCCNHLCSKTTITSSVNGRTFSVVNDSDLD